MNNVASSAAVVKVGKSALFSYQRWHHYKTYSTSHWCSSKPQPMRSLDVRLGVSSKCNRHYLYTSASRKSPKEESDGELHSEKVSYDPEGDCEKDHPTSSSSTSSSFQQHHRQSYEQKKSQYEKNKNNHRKAESNSSNQLPIEQLNHYQRLNIQPEADQDAIKTAYYNLSKIYHPDIANTDPNASETFRLLTESYDALSNVQTRASYDHSLNKAAPSDFFDKSSHPNRDFNLLYRTRDSDMIFRARHQAALQREKMLNPKKFRAGAFKGETDLVTEKSIQDELSKLKLRMNSISRNKTRHSKEGSDFYKLHLYDSIHRRHSDLIQHQHLYGGKSSTRSSEEGLFVGLMSILAIFGGILLVVADIFVTTDIPAMMDEKLKEFFKRKTSSKTVNKEEGPEEDLRKHLVLIKR